MASNMSIEEALLALAEPAPEPFRQVRWQPNDYTKWDMWNARRIEALNLAKEIQNA